MFEVQRVTRLLSYWSLSLDLFLIPGQVRTNSKSYFVMQSYEVLPNVN